MPLIASTPWKGISVGLKFPSSTSLQNNIGASAPTLLPLGCVSLGCLPQGCLPLGCLLLGCLPIGCLPPTPLG